MQACSCLKRFHLFTWDKIAFPVGEQDAEEALLESWFGANVQATMEEVIICYGMGMYCSWWKRHRVERCWRRAQHVFGRELSMNLCKCSALWFPHTYQRWQMGPSTGGINFHRAIVDAMNVARCIDYIW